MTYVKKLGTGVYLSAQEIIPVALLVLCSFLKTFALTSLDAGASVLFLTAYSGNCIGQTFVATAGLIFLIWPFLSTLKEKDELAPAKVLSVAAAVSAVLFLLFFFIHSPLLNGAVMVWKEGFRIIAETAFWVTAFRFGLFNGKTKTLFAVLCAQILAFLCAAGLIRISADHIEQLILWNALFAFAAACVLKMLIKNGSAPIMEKFAFRKRKIKRTGMDSLQRKLYLCFFVLSGTLLFGSGIVDYLFLKSTALNFNGQPVAIAKTFSSVFALTAVLICAVLFLSAKGKVSLLTLLHLIPVALILAACGGFGSIFALIAAGKAILGVATAEPKETTLQTIPLAVSLRSGFRATMLRKSLIEPIALLLCGLFVWYGAEKMTPVTLLYFTAGLAVILSLMIIMTRQVYLRLILNMLKSHLWRGGRLLLTGKRLNKQLTDSLACEQTEEVLYTLRVIEEAQSPLFQVYLKKALSHKNEDVRLYALSKIETLRLSNTLETIKKLADTDQSFKVRQTALRIICRLGTTKDRENAVDLIKNTDIREGALTGLMAAGREGVFVAIEQVAFLASSNDPADRKLAAVVLGNAGNSAFYHPLTYLLNDEDPNVIKAALSSAGKLLHPALLPAVMDTFRYPDLREDAVGVLLLYAEKAFPQIEAVLLNADYPFQFRIMLAKTIGKIPSPEAEAFLFKHIRIEDRRVRFNVIKALVLSNYKAGGKKVNTVRLCLYDEIETATGILAAINAFDKNKNEELTESLNILKSALHGEIDYIKERILLLLALLQPSATIKDLLNNYDSVNKDDATMIKIVDKILSGELRTLCLPLFEKKTVQQQLSLLRPHFYPPVLSVEGHIKDILTTPDGEFSDWTKACAAYAAGHTKDVSYIDSLVALLSYPDSIVRETAVWAIGRILPREEAARLLAESLNDPWPCVARMARFITDGTGQAVF